MGIKHKKFFSIVIWVLIIAFFAQIFIWLILYNPINSKSKHKNEITCLEYLSELLGRGTEIEVQSLKYCGFGLYNESVTYNKNELTSVSISGDKTGLGSYDSPFLICKETANLKYFSNKIIFSQKKHLSEKYNLAKIEYEQTGCKHLLTRNNLFDTQKTSDEILNESTNCVKTLTFYKSNMLFGFSQTLSLEKFCEYLNNIWSVSNLLSTYSMAIKTNDNSEGIVLFLRIGNDFTQENYMNKFNKILDFLIENESITRRLLSSQIFGYIDINFNEIKDYISDFGICTLGYSSVIQYNCDDVKNAINLQEEDNISKFIQLNNGIKVFI